MFKSLIFLSFAFTSHLILHALRIVPMITSYPVLTSQSGPGIVISNLCLLLKLTRQICKLDTITPMINFTAEETQNWII